jgi:hypothetical protein
MAELTIQIPDELAQQLEPLRDQLPELLSQLLNSTGLTASPLATTGSSELPQAYLEVIDFLIARPTSEDILAFKVSPEAQTRLTLLLDKSREGTLTAAELVELDVYEQLDHLITLIKARAMASVNQ